MAPTECLTNAKPPKAFGACDANHKMNPNMYELTISFPKTYKDKEKNLRFSDEEIYYSLDDGIKYLENAHSIHFLECNYENKDKKGRPVKPHVHALVISKVRLYPYPKLKGLRCHFTQQWKAKGLDGWLSYIKKQDSIQQSIKKAEVWFKQNYAFNEL